MTEYKRITKWEVPNCASVNGVSPIDTDIANAINRLAELEDLIEQGLLVKLPCKIGDTIYTVEWHTDWITERWDIYETQVSGFCIDEGGVRPVDFYGATIYEPFFTKAEAEARLAELTGGGK